MVSLVLTCLVLWPAFLDPSEDSFPLSTYPMFSRAKTDPSLVLTQALAVMPDGARKPLPPKLSTGNEEVIQSMKIIVDNTYGGGERAEQFCRDIASRVAATASSPWSEAAAIELARSHFDTVAYFEESPRPRHRRTLYRCPIAR
ncbi:MAG: hypothetical protein PVH21_05940 [Myxococcales bacterium]